MPYYQELFVNSSRKVMDLTPFVVYPPQDLLSVNETVLLTGYRSREPHKDAVASRPLLEFEVDPYASFLTSTDRERYDHALEQRGLTSSVTPDFGHPFELLRHKIVSLPLNDVTFYDGAWNFKGATAGYTGTGLDYVHTGNHVAFPESGNEGLHTFARQAYARVAPTSVQFDAAQFLGELLEGLPRLTLTLLKDQSRFFKNLGSDYLNLQFGWIPFLKDLRNAATALSKATRQLAATGEGVHRGYGVPPETSHGFSTNWNLYDLDLRLGSDWPVGMVPSGFPLPEMVEGLKYPQVGVYALREYSDVYANKSVTRNRWFEGVFSSFFPLDFDNESYLSRLDVLVNTNITPETLWELAPWSWLVDWTLRIGDNIRANLLRANDLLVMHYGYAMEKTIFTTNSSWSHPSPPSGAHFPKEGYMSVRSERKRRIRANPYGFGIGGADSLSGGQLAILGALGLTKFGR
jgi:hypothetical protein